MFHDFDPESTPTNRILFSLTGSMDPIAVVGFVAGITQLIDVNSKSCQLLQRSEECSERPSKACAQGHWSSCTLYRLEIPSGRGDHLDGSLDYWATVGYLSLLMKEETTAGFQEKSKLSLAMIDEIIEGFQEAKTNHDGRYYGIFIIFFSILILNIAAEKINRWLTAPLPSSNHNTAMKKTQSNTGEWFTQSKEFAEWKMGTSSFIWLHEIREL